MIGNARIGFGRFAVGIALVGASVVLSGGQAAMAAGYGRAIVTGNFDGAGAWDRDEIAVGAPWDNWGGTETGSVTVYWRDRNNRSTWLHDFLDQNRLNDPTMFTGGGDGGVEDYDHFGHTLAVGDFDGDGFKDLAIGVWEEDIGAAADAGCVHVLYGATSGPNGMPFRQSTTYLTRAAVFADVLPATPTAGDWFGYSLAAGDFDGDGRDDLAVGAPGVTVNGQALAGAVFLFYSGGATFPTNNEWTLVEGGPFSPTGTPQAGDYFGYAVAAGNFNGDSANSRQIMDLAVGAPLEDSGPEPYAGNVFVYSGRTSQPPNTANNVVLDSGVLGHLAGFGMSLVAADFNARSDARFDDLAIGAPYEGYSGAVYDGGVYVLYGSSSGLDNTTSPRQSWASISFSSVCSGYTSRQDYGYFGLTLTAGDAINDPNGGCQGQGCNPKELIIGAPNRSSAGAVNNGQIFVLKGTNDPNILLAPVAGGNACLNGPSTAFASGGLYGLTVAVGFLGNYPNQPVGSQPAADIVAGTAGIDKFSIRYGDLTDVSSQYTVFDWPW